MIRGVVIEAQHLALVPAARPATGQRRGATNVADVPTVAAPRFPEHVQRAEDAVCGRGNFRCDSVSVSAVTAPNNLQTSAILATKRGRLSTG
jgi:hypothetical protein